MSIKIYLVNLDRSPDRLAFMTKQLNYLNLPFERVSAVDGRQLSEELVSKLAVRSRIEEWPELLTPNMIACSLSHYNIYMKIQQDNVDYALILEDDVKIEADLPLILANIKKLLNKEDVFLVYFHGEEKKFSSLDKVPIIGDYAIYKAISVWGAYSTGGYIISKEVAQKLSNYVFPIHTTPDSWGMFYRDGVIKGLWAVLPLVASSANFGSDIGYHKLNKMIRSVEKLPFRIISNSMRYLRRKLNRGASKYKIISQPTQWVDSNG